jgi:hypothetical protein
LTPERRNLDRKNALLLKEGSSGLDHLRIFSSTPLYFRNNHAELDSRSRLELVAVGNEAQAHDPICADACLTIATNFVYGGCSGTDDLYYACRCVSPEFLGTLALCVQENCPSSEWEWLDVEICQGYGESSPIPSLESVLANATQFGGPPPDNLTDVLTYPLIVPSTIFQASYDTSK